VLSFCFYLCKNGARSEDICGMLRKKRFLSPVASLGFVDNFNADKDSFEETSLT